MRVPDRISSPGRAGMQARISASRRGHLTEFTIWFLVLWIYVCAIQDSALSCLT
ncbi:protein of unknown function [Cupriavidus taiwanensis]|uniref:Uncharacterized protein n=1 Tax=Cupriavidus taiwanensis TaxID=164546 RepID=A0A7Z7J7B3_9BURK|nr:protein of unknown function [Cupriavidus taiwanensis]SOY99743.1 hypothetical protein CBM2595_A10086 [Cupriavidus taiwanensis]SOZ02786.1 hypothetical protein CBM2597_A10115 [Cupriavidus taiwanensis]SPC06153.1 hypothetical protein CBM2594_A10115 [Cupriavidus taiwanensis]SPD38184.1 protein of unknown function [Cupriavidus taiwanensis]